eukprot:11896_1
MGLGRMGFGGGDLKGQQRQRCFKLGKELRVVLTDTGLLLNELEGLLEASRANQLNQTLLFHPKQRSVAFQNLWVQIVEPLYRRLHVPFLYRRANGHAIGDRGKVYIHLPRLTPKSLCRVLVSFYDKKIENELVEVLLRHIRRCKPLLPVAHFNSLSSHFPLCPRLS